MQNALYASAYRGVDTTIVFPARNDSWVVAAASRSQYADMRQRQQDYIARSHPVDPDVVAAWPMTRCLWNNTIAMLGPLL